MSTFARGSAEGRPGARADLMPLVLLLFVGSGCAALIYEIVWFQLLQRIIGSSAISLAVLLGTFMGGMCLGSLILPRLVSAAHHPLRVYALLEVAIGFSGLVVLFAMPVLGRLYLNLVGHGLPGLLLRAFICVLCLLPPTMMMGATLPAIARWVESTPHGMSRLGYFYCGNIVGAVTGCLLAGFYLLRVHNLPTATLCAAALNLAVALLALLLARRAPRRTASAAGTPAIHGPPAAAAPVLAVLVLSGFCALAAEVIWTRSLSLLLGATVYTFSIILAVFLTGLGLGSGIGSALARHVSRPRLALATCQALQVATLFWAAHAMHTVLPYLAVDDSILAKPWLKFQIDLARAAGAILPAAMLWGASFPLALAGIVRPGQDPGRLVGVAYAFNTLGAIAGAVAAGMMLVPAFGTQNALRLLMALSLASAIIAFPPRGSAALGGVLAAGFAALALGLSLPPLPWQLVAYGRHTATTDFGARPLYLGEGMNATVAVTETAEGARYFHVSGKTEASSLTKDMRLQRMLGHLPALLHPAPRSVLIVGCGAGVTAGSFALYPSIKRIVICEIEPLIPRIVATHFREENHDILRDPRVEVIHDDARHYIATTRETFDLITSDPIHPWVKGSAVLYSQEYFELCRRRLNPGGLMSQWVPFYESDRAVVQSEIATFFSVFPEGTIWGNDDEGHGYDTVMLGQAGPLRVDVDALEQRFARSEHDRVAWALAPLGIDSAPALLGTYAGRFADLRDWLAHAEINRERDLRLQYLAGLQLDSTQGPDAYGEMLAYLRFPAEIFQASPARLKVLQEALQDRLPAP